MNSFPCHTMETAPEAAKPLLEKSQRSFGLIPNMHGVMAEAPPVLDAYLTLHELAMSTSFSLEEKAVIWQTINVEHHCSYCATALSGAARAMGVSPDLDEALRNQCDLSDEKLNALHLFTLAVVRNRGVLGGELDQFFKAGYNRQNALEVILFVSQKVLSNYVNHIAHTEVDEKFKEFLREKP